MVIAFTPFWASINWSSKSSSFSRGQNPAKVKLDPAETADAKAKRHSCGQYLRYSRQAIIHQTFQCHKYRVVCISACHTSIYFWPVWKGLHYSPKCNILKFYAPCTMRSTLDIVLPKGDSECGNFRKQWILDKEKSKFSLKFFKNHS